MSRNALLLCTVLLVLTLFGKKVSGAHKITAEEQKTLDQFRPSVEHLLYRDFMKTDEYVLRWLKVARFNQDKAKSMLERNTAWRKSERIDDLLEEDLSKVDKCLKIYTTDGRDREGRPILYAHMGAWYIRKCALSGNIRAATRLAIRGLFEGPLNNASSTGTYVIADLTGFNVVEMACLACLPLYTQLAYSFDNDYPGLHHRVNLVNAPRTFDVIWSLITPILTPQSKEAMRLYGLDKNKYGPTLLKEIEAAQLLAAYGGTKRI